MSALYLLRDAATVIKGLPQSAGSTPDSEGVRSIQVGVRCAAVPATVVSATVSLYGCNDLRYPKLIATYVGSGAGDGTTNDAIDVNFPWEYFFATVDAISGAGATVDAILRV